MKKVLLIIIFLLSALRVVAPEQKAIFVPHSPPVEPFKKLIHAVGMVEAKGDTTAFNKIEQAVGFFQIRPIRVEDYNKRTGSNYLHAEMYDYKISEKIFLYYASQIGPNNFEHIARNWNGSGPRTTYYWNRVKKYL